MLVGKRQRKRPCVRPSRKCEDNVTIDLFREVGWEGVGWIHLAQVRGQWWDIVKR